MQKILWIDNNPNNLINFVAPVVKTFWENDIKSDIYIAKNLAQDSAIDDFSESMKRLSDVIASNFIDYLIENDIFENCDVAKKYALINDDNTRTPLPFSTVVTTNIDDISISDNVINDWSKFINELFLENNDPKNPKQFMSEFRKNKPLYDSLQEIIKNIKKSYSAVFINVGLLEKDRVNLFNENIIPIFSMLLYFLAKENGLDAYLYHSYTNAEWYVTHWNNIYRTIFSKDSNEIDFLNRKGEKTISINI